MSSTNTVAGGRTLIYRIPALVRTAHWVIALALLVLLLSGLQIFNAHPALYWGNGSPSGHSFFEIGARGNKRGEARGFVRLGSFQANTTGVLGVAKNGEGQLSAHAFPRWITLPPYQDLADGRRWHFFFAWLLSLGLATYVIANLIRGRLWRGLFPTTTQLRGIGSSIWEHLRLRLPHGEEARQYNVLQKLAYLSIMFGVIPLVIVTGLALSPAIDAALPWLTQILGGRQSARSLHFIGTWVLVLFFFTHILMVVAAGPLNEMRSIITGWFAIRPEPARERHRS